MRPGPYVLRGVLGVLAIVAVGVALSGSRAEGAGVTITEARFQRVAVGSGLRQRVVSTAFEGGSTKAVMGGLNLDLRDAEIAGDEAVIDVRALFGGVDLRVPEDWVVETNVRAVFGGVENRARVPDL